LKISADLIGSLEIKLSTQPSFENLYKFGLCVGIHEHCTVTEILVFGRETGFLTQIQQRWFLYKSPQEMETNLI
jgi:dihydroorotase